MKNFIFGKILVVTHEITNSQKEIYAYERNCTQAIEIKSLREQANDVEGV